MLTGIHLDKQDVDYTAIGELLDAEAKKNIASVSIPPKKRGSDVEPVCKFKMLKSLPVEFESQFIGKMQDMAVEEAEGIFIVDTTMLKSGIHMFIIENMTSLPLPEMTVNDVSQVNALRALHFGEYLAKNNAVYSKLYEDMYAFGLRECIRNANTMNTFSAHLMAAASDISKLFQDGDVYNMLKDILGQSVDDAE